MEEEESELSECMRRSESNGWNRRKEGRSNQSGPGVTWRPAGASLKLTEPRISICGGFGKAKKKRGRYVYEWQLDDFLQLISPPLPFLDPFFSRQSH